MVNGFRYTLLVALCAATSAATLTAQEFEVRQQPTRQQPTQQQPSQQGEGEVDAVLSQDELVVMLHPLNDLYATGKKPERAPQEAKARPKPPTHGPSSFIAEQAQRMRQKESLTRLWLLGVEAEAGRKLAARESLQFAGHTMILTARQDLQDAARALIQRQREQAKAECGLVFESWLLSLDAESYREHFAPVLDEAGRHEPFVAPFARSKEDPRTKIAKWLLSRLQMPKAAPKMLLLPAQQASLLAIEQHAYIRDFELTKLIDGTTIADPVVGIVEEGFGGIAQVLVLEEKRYVVQLAWADAELTRPIQKLEAKLPLPSTRPVTIQLPELTLRKVATCLELRHGDRCVITLGQAKGRYEVLAFRMRSRVPSERRK
jgi:hypothetical protein